MDKPPEPSGRQAEDDGLNERKAILQSLFRGLISLQIAAGQLASISLKESGIENGLCRTWQTILGDVKETTDHHKKLSELLVSISHLPPAKNEEGKQLTVGDLRIWGELWLQGLSCRRGNAVNRLTLDDLPCFAWELHDDWRYCINTSPVDDLHAIRTLTRFLDAHRQTHITTFVNVNKFAAQILRTPHSILTGSNHFGKFALWLMRAALEYPGNDRELEPLETYLPAAVAWVSILGQEIFSWDNEFPSGKREGDPGRGGPLWDGQHGFCKERWNLWKQRFTELSSSNELTKELRELAAEGAIKMGEAEAPAA
jgi:hypothetical protein